MTNKISPAHLRRRVHAHPHPSSSPAVVHMRTTTSVGPCLGSTAVRTPTRAAPAFSIVTSRIVVIRLTVIVVVSWPALSLGVRGAIVVVPSRPHRTVIIAKASSGVAPRITRTILPRVSLEASLLAPGTVHRRQRRQRRRTGGTPRRRAGLDCRMRGRRARRVDRVTCSGIGV